MDAPRCLAGAGDFARPELGELPTLSDALPACLLEPVEFGPRDSDGTQAKTAVVRRDGAAARRDRRRIAEQKRHLARQRRRRDLAAQVAELERQLQQLMLAQTGENDATFQLAKVDFASGVTFGRVELEQLVSGALRSKVLLREENAALRRRLMGFTQQRLSLRHALNIEQTLCVSSGSSFVVLKSLTPEQCRQFQVEGTELAETFLAHTIQSNSWVRTVHSWREGRSVHLGVYNYIYKKTIKDCLADDLCGRSFATLADPTLLEKFYSAEQNVNLRVLQKVDEDNVVLFEEMVLRDTDEELVVSKAIVLVARVTTAAGYRIHMQCLDIDKLPVQCRYESSPSSNARLGQTVREIWLSRMQWMQIDTYGTDCVVSYAGIIPTEGFSVQFWVEDFVLDALQWEFLIKPTPFRLRTY